MWTWLIGGVMIILALAAVYFLPKGWKTIGANFAAMLPMLVLWILDALSGIRWSDVFDPQAAAIIAPLVNGLNIYLRRVTAKELTGPPA